MQKLTTLLFVVIAGSQLGATDCGVATRDSGFDLWCGDQMCAWVVTRGDVKRVPTWNEGDSGVELLGPDTAIEQLSPVNSSDGTCLRFELVADIEPTAEVFLNVDIHGEGNVELAERFPAANWKPLSFNFLVMSPYDGIRFELAKRGTGRAVLAQIKASTRDAKECEGLTALDPGPRANGATCVIGSTPTICASGICDANPVYQPHSGFFLGACMGCRRGDDSTCGAGETCGLGPAALPIFPMTVECVPRAAKELGEKCIVNTECASNLCDRVGNAGYGVCSSCVADSMCPSGQQCKPAWDFGINGGNGPYVCGAGEHLAASGAPCGHDNDCASGACNGGARHECADGRACSDAADCPFGIDPGSKPLQNGACEHVGIQGGTCQ